MRRFRKQILKSEEPITVGQPNYVTLAAFDINFPTYGGALRWTPPESIGQHSGHALTGYCVRTKDRTVARTFCESGDGADGSFKRPQARALYLLHTEMTCERTFQMHGCRTSKMSRFYSFLNVQQRPKNGYISFKKFHRLLRQALG